MKMKVKRLFQTVAVIALVASSIFLFQNCTKSGFQSDSSTLDQVLNESAAVAVDPVFAKLPFPYDVSVNQIAHMSCALNVSSTDVATPYFSWAVGAFDNPADVPTGNGFKSFKISQTAGLQLNSDFLTQFQTITKNYNPEVVPGKFKSLLQTHPTVSGVQLQLSLRKRNAVRTDLMKLLTSTGEVSSDSPTKMIMEPLSSDAVAGYFSTHPKSLVHEISTITSTSSKYLDARLNVPSAYGAQNANLISNYDQSYLTVGFATGQADLVDSLTTTNLASPSTTADKTKAYGVGFRPYFGVVNAHKGTDQYPSVDALTGLQEFNLKTGNQVSDGSSWRCDYKFKIVLNKDRQNTFYRENHFLKILNTTTNQYECPGIEYTSGTLCTSPINPDFGIPATDFIAAGSTQATVNLGCPMNRSPVTASATVKICAERYPVLCPSEPYYPPVASTALPYMREDGLYNSKYPERAALFHALRRFLPADKWDINVSRRCIVPKMDDNVCYASGGSAPVVYDDTFFKGIVNQIQSNGAARSPATSVDLSLDANPNMGRYSGCGVNGQYPCSAYLTLCLRTKP